MSSTGKLDYLNSVESFKQVNADVDHHKKKFMATFPYPYMNGRLHLGHVYSFSRIDFLCNFRRMQGYNVFLPFGFHCTGMPISASAHKLERELSGHDVDVSIKGILKGLGFGDVEPFTDPLHWIRTFPGLAVDVLKSFHAGIDWRSSFITTDLNRYYDSFVRYQFNKLKRLNLLNFGKRYSVFCPIDRQACLDHDRRKGEGVKPTEAILRKIEIGGGAVLLVKCAGVTPVEKLVFSKDRQLVQFELGDRMFVVEDKYFDSLVFQIDGVKKTKEIPAREFCTDEYQVQLVDADMMGKAVVKGNTGNCEEFEEIMAIKNEEMVLVETVNFVKIYIPEDVAISRSGAVCVVALLDQWYIDYSLPEWKEKARKCIERMTITEDTRRQLNDALEQMYKWGFSRSFGLGTRIPWDTQYLIDSLSDSTIYNAFYTVKQFLFRDLEGRDEIFPASELCDDVWMFLFGDTETLPAGLDAHRDILERAKESFEYFYPVDIRCSGKDLINNHLVFYIMNHVALFDEKYWPRRIFTNGHLLLNSAKMSKSDGNFLSADEAIARYGASATRMCLADCGDTNEDANFLEATANSMVLKLYTLVKTVEGLKAASDENVLVGMMNKMALSPEARKSFLVNEMFLQSISKNIEETLRSYENMVYRDVLKFGFYENLRLIEQYSALGGSNQTILSYGYKTLLSLVYPIIPGLVGYLHSSVFGGEIEIPRIYRQGNDLTKALEHIKDVCSRINSEKGKATKVVIGVSDEYHEWKRECIRIVDGCSEKREILQKVDAVLKKHGISKNKGVIFCMDYFEYRDKYTVIFDEKDILEVFSDFIGQSTQLQIEVDENQEAEPLNPKFKFE